MKYVNILGNEIYYKGVVLIESLKDLEKYYDDFRKPQVHSALDKIRGGLHTQLGSLGVDLVRIKTGSNHHGHVVGLLASMTGDVYANQLRLLLDGNRIAINLNGSYFPIPKDAIIEDATVENNTIFKSKF